MRYTSATLLIAQGVHAKIISERLGHSNIQITLGTYEHALRSADEQAIEALDKLFAKNNKPEKRNKRYFIPLILMNYNLLQSIYNNFYINEPVLVILYNCL